MRKLIGKSSDVLSQYNHIGYAALFCILIYWSLTLLQPPNSAQPPWIFLDYLNLAIHEAGHWVFAIFGQFMSILGGSLLQILTPLSVVVSFAFQRNWPGAAF